MPPKVAMQASRWIGLALTLLGLLGFVSNPFIGANAAIEADVVQNVAHIVLGLYLFGMSFAGESSAAFNLYIASGILFLFAGLAYVELGSFQRGFLWNATWANRASIYFHVAMALLMALFGKMNTASKQLFYN